MAVGVRPLVTVCEDDEDCDRLKVCDPVCVGLLVGDGEGLVTCEADPVRLVLID